MFGRIMATISAFSTLIWNKKLTSAALSTRLNRELNSSIKSLLEGDRAGWAWSNKNYLGGYTSYGSLSNLHQLNSSFTDLRLHIDKHVQKFARELHWDLKGKKLQMTTCWVNVMPNQVSHSLHLHPLAVISGTYYLKVPKGSGPLKFEDPRLGLFMGSPPRKASGPKTQQPFLSLQPEAGQVVLFESWLRHEVPPNAGQGLRTSVSFNYEWL